jgi:hypothetical protein
MVEVQSDPRPGVSMADLISEAVEESRSLLQTELLLAREEIQGEIQAARTAAIAFGAAALALTLSLSVLLTALVLVLLPAALWALIIGLFLLLVASAAAFFAYRKLPKRPMNETRARITTDVQVFKERLA